MKNGKTTKAADKTKKADKKEKKAQKFVVVEGNEYNGKPMFTIAREEDVDKNGNFVGKFPAVTFGMGKASILVQFLDELTEFVEANS